MKGPCLASDGLCYNFSDGVAEHALVSLENRVADQEELV